MALRIDPSSDRPAYRQIADHLRSSILSGEIAPGSPIPSEQELCDRYNAARGTVSKKKRARAAARYRPERVRLLLIAEAPPDSEERYFYLEGVRDKDSLFRYVAKGILGYVPDRASKPTALSELKDRGVFLIDASEGPLGDRSLDADPIELILRCEALQPEHIILIKVNVYDDLFAPLKAAGLPVVDVRMPFPGSGQQKRFEAAFKEALAMAGWENERSK
ncbi:MAG TPA: winged helix-turn-helix domain-containing protein [Actinomycetota bacterium]|nr:winged helix-turn-helix domain-containing protein [Actinomycetota bacterium]